MRDAQSLVCVHRGTDPVEANILRGMLETEGVEVTLTGEGLVGAYSGVPRVADVCIMVPRRKRDRALALIRAYEARPAAPNPGWRCTNCLELNEPGFEICWRCRYDPGEEEKTADIGRNA